MYDILHCFIFRPSDSNVSEDAGIEPRPVATPALAARRSNLSARSHPQNLILLPSSKIIRRLFWPKKYSYRQPTLLWPLNHILADFFLQLMRGGHLRELYKLL